MHVKKASLPFIINAQIINLIIVEHVQMTFDEKYCTTLGIIEGKCLSNRTLLNY
jgi:hypothetical protein